MLYFVFIFLVPLSKTLKDKSNAGLIVFRVSWLLFLLQTLTEGEIKILAVV